MNIVTGQIAHPGVNADNALSLGHRIMENFKGGWPNSSYCPIGKLDVTMDVKKNNVLVGRNVSMTRNSSTHVSLLVCLQAHERSTSMNVLAFELAAYPPSIFNVDGNMNVATSKSTLKHQLLVTISERNCPISDTMIYDLFAFSGLSPGRLVNCVSTWTPLRHSSIKLYDAQMSSSCLIGTSPTASRHSRGRRDQDQVASIN